jgi:hypothetical protein
MAGPRVERYIDNTVTGAATLMGTVLNAADTRSERLRPNMSQITGSRPLSNLKNEEYNCMSNRCSLDPNHKKTP